MSSFVTCIAAMLMRGRALLGLLSFLRFKALDESHKAQNVCAVRSRSDGGPPTRPYVVANIVLWQIDSELLRPGVFRSSVTVSR